MLAATVPGSAGSGAASEPAITRPLRLRCAMAGQGAVDGGVDTRPRRDAPPTPWRCSRSCSSPAGRLVGFAAWRGFLSAPASDTARHHWPRPTPRHRSRHLRSNPPCGHGRGRSGQPPRQLSADAARAELGRVRKTLGRPPCAGSDSSSVTCRTRQPAGEKWRPWPGGTSPSRPSPRRARPGDCHGHHCRRVVHQRQAGAVQGAVRRQP